MNFAESKSFFRQLLQKHSVFQAPWNRPLFSETQSLENIPYLKNAVPKHKAVAGPIRSPHKRSFPNVCGGRKKNIMGRIAGRTRQRLAPNYRDMTLVAMSVSLWSFTRKSHYLFKIHTSFSSLVLMREKEHFTKRINHPP